MARRADITKTMRLYCPDHPKAKLYPVNYEIKPLRDIPVWKCDKCGDYILSDIVDRANAHSFEARGTQNYEEFIAMFLKGVNRD